ncbi:HAMP domain-containing protein [Fodinisporobacter ferrooxydans]|uniref:histidine kinase n=1 Tax=Fodinisporobacter ferrooxydans TaxID=2901836 RepID=A0ABY4CK67_9BACL|nr:HAMP domain-containing protein [Alicyclobacillaceae bacterium MYW30-H2]
MISKLRTRLFLALVGITFIIVLIASLLIIWQTNRHFMIYQMQMPAFHKYIVPLDLHLKTALIQSILLTMIGAMVLAIAVSFYMAKRMTRPIEDMTRVAKRIGHGDLHSRVAIQGNDELAKLATTLNQLASQLQTQEELRRNLTADVAHELRTPLATLKGHMEAFEDRIWEPTPERIHSCYEEIERLIGLVSDLEQLSFIESPELVLDLQVHNLSDIILQCVDMMCVECVQKGIEWNVCVEESG